METIIAAIILAIAYLIRAWMDNRADEHIAAMHPEYPQDDELVAKLRAFVNDEPICTISTCSYCFHAKRGNA